MSRRMGKLTLLAVLGLGLVACSNSREVSQSEYTSTPSQTTSLDTTPAIAGEGGVPFTIGNKKKESEGTGGITVNAYLWRATLDTLAFMPLISADPLGGVIITDWWVPDSTPSERLKATAYITTRSLRSDGIRVTIFRQVEQNSEWKSVSVSPSTAGEIEAKILARARELRQSYASR